jgi:imidazole glycerol-phosphate synthase subunit HisH
MIVIINYGMGNLGSVLNMFKKIGVHDVQISSELAEIEKADKLILPGVGAFDSGMKNLAERGLIDLLNHKVLLQKTPVLGLCLGMQLFSNCSEEGRLPGLGWIEAETIRFKNEGGKETIKIPHMGWNTIKIEKPHPLFADLGEQPRFYFVHSYYVKCRSFADVFSMTNYSIDFASVVVKNNIMGVQFHPEKSHRFGMQLLKNFAGISPC